MSAKNNESSLGRFWRSLRHEPDSDPFRDPFDSTGIGGLRPYHVQPRAATPATPPATAGGSPPFHRGRRLLLLGGIALTVAYTPDPQANAIDFFTDFMEKDPLRFWTNGLTVQPEGDRMAAIPRQTTLALPSEGLKDGRAVFHFANTAQQAATFVFRTQEDQVHGYLATCARIVDRGQPQLAITIDKRSRRGVKRVETAIVKDFYLATQNLQRLWLEMDGPDFTLRLERAKAKSRFDLFEPEAESKVVHTWKDSAYRDGLVGLHGRAANASLNQFRVYSVSVEG